MNSITAKPIISADSHITEPPDVFKYIDKKYAATAPKMVRQDNGSDLFVIEGMPDPFPIMLASSAGYPSDKLGARALESFENSYQGGWNPKARLADQEHDGLWAEVLYPSLGLFLCNHPDPAYKTACFNAYNLWLAEFCEEDPQRLIGLGQTAMESPEQGIKDLERIRDLGLRGVLMPGWPVQEDYWHPMYDPFWEAAVDMNIPLSFHILTYKDGMANNVRGPQLNRFMAIMRGNQDIIGTLIFGAVFDRHPKLKVVCVEADAGWAPHYMYRMDHAYRRATPGALAESPLTRMPSEYFMDNVYVTFQDDEVAFKVMDMLNSKHLMWASDFPHLDSTYPHSQELLLEHTMHLSQEQRDDLLYNNVARLYGL